MAALRRVLACHLCGDQHLSVVVKHGIDEFRDGPYAFTNPAIINSYYGRWWWPADEKAGANPIPGSPLPWTGDYLDGLYNHITMIAYANPAFDNDRGDAAEPAQPRGVARRRLRSGAFQQEDATRRPSNAGPATPTSPRATPPSIPAGR